MQPGEAERRKRALAGSARSLSASLLSSPVSPLLLPSHLSPLLLRSLRSSSHPPPAHPLRSPVSFSPPARSRVPARTHRPLSNYHIHHPQDLSPCVCARVSSSLRLPPPQKKARWVPLLSAPRKYLLPPFASPLPFSRITCTGLFLNEKTRKRDSHYSDPCTHLSPPPPSPGEKGVL